jgi:hypothetical protein
MRAADPAATMVELISATCSLFVSPLEGSAIA